MKLVEVESPEEAALLRGHSLLIPASAREALENEDEFYVQVGAALVLLRRRQSDEEHRGCPCGTHCCCG